MSLVEYARDELNYAGLFDKDSDYGGDLGNAVLELIEKFSEQGHSGFSAALTTDVFSKLSRMEPLSPLTGEPDEWGILDYDDETYAQNKRDSRVFMRRDGSAYFLDGKIFREPNGSCYTSSESKVEVEFPCTPESIYVDVEESE